MGCAKGRSSGIRQACRATTVRVCIVVGVGQDRGDAHNFFSLEFFDMLPHCCSAKDVMSDSMLGVAIEVLSHDAWCHQ